jgi:predicted class III extradiol MEMO1 family dioxygenase
MLIVGDNVIVIVSVDMWHYVVADWGLSVDSVLLLAYMTDYILQVMVYMSIYRLD